MATNMAEQLFKSMDVIVSQRLEGIKFDTSELCTITNADNAKEGKYKVSNGSATYYAYTTVDNYKVDDQVYVTIPNNDYNQQKIITGKYVSEDTTPFVFTTPFDTIVDISSNLIIGSQSVGQLLANDKNIFAEFDSYPAEVQLQADWKEALSDLETEYKSSSNTMSATEYSEAIKAINTEYTKKETALAKDFDEKYMDCEEKIIWQKDYTNNPLMGYTRLGLQGQFRSWLNSQSCIIGEYGYKLRVKCLNKNTTSSETESTDADSYTYYDLYLNQDDMYGNPYNFETYYQQEKVFDISNFNQIVGLTLYFYQKTDSFKNDSGELLPYKDFLGNKLSKNLFEKDPFICIGYDLSSFDKEKAILTCADSSTFTNDISTTDTDGNIKHIVLNWIHQFSEDEINSVSADSDLLFEIRWYRYKQGAQQADEYSDVEWTSLTTDSTKQFYYVLEPDITKPQEKVKVVILYRESDDITVPTKIFSNVITFTNEKEVVNSADQAFNRGLNIWCEDNSYGNYRVYDSGNALLNEEYKTLRMFVSAYFNDYEDGDEENSSLVYEAESIEWTFPASKTQLIVDNFDYSTYTPEAGYYDDATVTYDPTADTITILRKGDKNNNYAVDGQQLYGIRTSYAAENTSNTVECKLVKNNTTYTSSKEFTFGIAGTTGTDYTLELDFERNEWALTSAKDVDSAKKEDSPVYTVKAFLYDEKNQLVDIQDTTNNPNVKITWQWAHYVCEELDPLKVKQDTSTIRTFSKTLMLSPVQSSSEDASGNLTIYNPEYLNNGTYVAVSSSSTRNTDGDVEYYTSTDGGTTYTAFDEDATDSEWEEAQSEGILYAKIINPLLDIDNTSKTYVSTDPDRVTFTYDWTKLPMNTFLILQCTISGWGDYDLVAYKPIPVRKYSTGTYQYRSIEGPTLVFYDSYGKINVSNIPYQMKIAKSPYTAADITVGEGDWIIYNPYGEKYNFIGTLSDSYALKPSSIYISGAKPYGVQYREYNLVATSDEDKETVKTLQDNLATAKTNYAAAVKAYDDYEGTDKTQIETLEKAVTTARTAVSTAYDAIVDAGYMQTYWTQPIVILQNQYPSSTMNKWNGKDLEVNYDKGYIVSPAIATGKKNSDNTFSGLMLGDWNGRGADKFTSAKTGIYGFDHGAMSYAFREDGTAFIGKSGAGRIEFDGNKGQISSSSYWTLGSATKDAQQNGTGMLIDLDDGYIDIKGATKTSVTTNTSVSTEGEGYTVTKYQYIKNGAEVQIGVTGSPYFGITSKAGNKLIWIADDGYYLQSDNFGSGSGMNININTGRITAYNFYLQAGTSPYYIEMDSTSTTLGEKTPYYFGGFNNQFDIETETGTMTNEASEVDLYVNKASFPLKIGVTTPYTVTQKISTAITDNKDNRAKIIEIAGSGFAVNWAGEIYASAGVLGNWVLSKEGLFTSQNFDLPYEITKVDTSAKEDDTDEGTSGTEDKTSESQASYTIPVKIGMSSQTGEIFGTAIRAVGWGITSYAVYSRFKLSSSLKDDGAGNSIASKSAGGFYLKFVDNLTAANISYDGSVTGCSIIGGQYRNFYVSATSGSVYINKGGRATEDVFFYAGSPYGKLKSVHIYSKKITFHTPAASQYGIYARFA